MGSLRPLSRIGGFLLGPDRFQTLLQAGTLEFLYEDHLLGINTHTDPIGFKRFTPLRLMSPEHVLDRKLWEIAIEVTGKEGRGRRAAQRLAPLIRSVNVDSRFDDCLQSIFNDPPLLESAVRTMLARLVPEFPSTQPFKFMLQKTDKGYVLNSDLPFDRLNHYYRQRVSSADSTIDPAFLLSNIAQGEIHAFFAARQISELAADPVGADLAALRNGLYRSARAKE